MNMKILFVFIDGLGLGEPDPEKNPVYAAAPNLQSLMRNSRMFPTDASMGVPGLPQSATGQTAIFTGVNASMVLGRHLNAQPTVTLKKIINENNLFMELLQRGIRVTNSNVYREEYLTKMLDPKERRLRPSVTSVMCLASDVPFRTVDDYKNGKGIYHDITGRMIHESGYDTEIITPREAAERLHALSRNYDFTLYEHFMTDIIGHKMDKELAVSHIQLLDEFLGELVRCINPKEDILLITSDHGNIEDISVKTHTHNKVPTIIHGDLPEGVEVHIESLLDIMPAVLRMMGDELPL
jgi:2,3-bisphosphoglycerate-independent phosphoglycerate mutase